MWSITGWGAQEWEAFGVVMAAAVGLAGGAIALVGKVVGMIWSFLAISTRKEKPDDPDLFIVQRLRPKPLTLRSRETAAARYVAYIVASLLLGCAVTWISTFESVQQSGFPRSFSYTGLLLLLAIILIHSSRFPAMLIPYTFPYGDDSFRFHFAFIGSMIYIPMFTAFAIGTIWDLVAGSHSEGYKIVFTWHILVALTTLAESVLLAFIVWKGRMGRRRQLQEQRAFIDAWRMKPKQMFRVEVRNDDIRDFQQSFIESQLFSNRDEVLADQLAALPHTDTSTLLDPAATAQPTRPARL